MSESRFPHRVAGLRQTLAQPYKAVDTPMPPTEAAIISNLENVRYLTGFSGSNGLAVVSADANVFITDGRYTLQASREVPGWEQVILPQGSDLAAEASQVIEKLGAKRVAFEASHTTYNGFAALEKAMPSNVELVGRVDLVESLRAIKDADEIAALKRAIAVADECFDSIRNTARVGMTEKQLAWEMETFMRATRGATRLSFESIVGSGPNSALIHGRPSDRVIGSSGGPEFLLCDYGCELDGYCSDITRTFVIGGQPTERMVSFYNSVLRAQLAAIDAIHPGAAGKDVDAVARELLTADGLGEAFGHGLGHGLGRVVHDGQAFSQKSTVTLAAGMVVTVEPGAYIEDFGGVRIEDDVLVTENGSEILTHSTKDLIVL